MSAMLSGIVRTSAAAQSRLRVLPTNPDMPRMAVARVVAGLAALAALLIALALPATFFAAARYRVLGALEASATLHALEIAELSRLSPAFWELSAVKVTAPEQGRASGELRRVFNNEGRLILEAVPAEVPEWPLASVEAMISVDGVIYGRTVAARSLWRPLIATLIVGLCSSALGGLIYVILRVAPLRLLDDALRRASFLAAHDLLTGLPNRGLFADRLSQALARARRDHGITAVLCLDLDRFKEVNDTLGHAAGDELLKVVAARMSSCLREGDTLARLGGDEFAIIQPDIQQPEAADALARRLTTALSEPVLLNAGQALIGVSVGIAMSAPDQPLDGTQVMRNADLALYRAKEAGRGGHCFFAPEMNQKLHERRALEIDLRLALANGSFRLAYQPQIRLDTGRITGAEALLRWERPDHGNISPDQFIPLAEETGLIGQIGAWAIKEACLQASRWAEPLSIAVNVSPVQFRQAGFYDVVVSALRCSGLSPERLELEITEGVLLNDTEDTLAILGRLRQLGIKIAMDDFGTGYSSLGYLQRFPFDKIKIDRSFVRNLGQDPNAAAIVNAVMGMSRALGVRANAEGVEFKTQADLLLSQGCDEVQGYFFAKPMPSEAFAGLIGMGLPVAQS
nr:EAL domain-containing protein [Pseudoroseomonas vastitatis]